MDEINIDEIYSDLNNIVNLTIKIKNFICPITEHQSQCLQKSMNLNKQEKFAHNVINQFYLKEMNNMQFELKEEIILKDETRAEAINTQSTSDVVVGIKDETQNNVIIKNILSNDEPVTYNYEKFKKSYYINPDSYVTELEKIKKQNIYYFEKYKNEQEQKPQQGEKIIQGNNQFLQKWGNQIIAEAQDLGHSDYLSEMAVWDEHKEQLSKFQISKCNQPSTQEWWVNHGIQKNKFKAKIDISKQKSITLPITLKFDTGFYTQIDKETDEKNTAIFQGWMFMFNTYNEKQVDDQLNLKIIQDPKTDKQSKYFNQLIQNIPSDIFQIETNEISHNTTEDTIKKKLHLKEIVVSKNCTIKNFWLQIENRRLTDNKN